MYLHDRTAFRDARQSRDDEECNKRKKFLRWDNGPTKVCPRCDERPGAGICPAAGTLSEFVQLFDRAVVICRGVTCARHESGYWPVDLEIDILNVDEFNHELASHSHPRVAAALGLVSSPMVKSHWAETIRHRVLGLLAHLTAVLTSRARNHSNVVVFESDLRPVERHALSAKLVRELGDVLRSRKWEVLRPSGYYYKFSDYRHRELNGTCPTECLCHRWGNMNRACEVRPGCNIKNLELYAINQAAYPSFEALHARALSRLASINAAVASRPSQSEETILARFDKEAFPWNDVWLPASFRSVLILPQIVVQQIKQGDVITSERFARTCRVW